MNENLKQLSERAQLKLNTYGAAGFLFNSGKSHPQVINLLEPYVEDKDLLLEIVDKSMNDEWDKLHELAKKLSIEGKSHGEILFEIHQFESDEEIGEWIAQNWYQVKILYMESVIESPTNIMEGSTWVIISAVAIVFLFLINSSWVPKTLWIASFLASGFQWYYGYRQRAISNKLNKFFTAYEPD